MQPRKGTPREVAAVALLMLITLFATAWHVTDAPDVFMDELVYARASVRTVGEGALAWDGGGAFMVHPPLYFLAEGAWLAITGPLPTTTTAGTVDLVERGRYLQAILATCTTLAIYLLGRRVGGPAAGLLAAALFAVDPFCLRTNRRAMIETLAGLLSLCGLLVIAPDREDPAAPPSARAIVSGLLLGLALLTKEIAFVAPLSVALVGLWCKVRGRRTPDRIESSRGNSFLLVALVAALTWAIYPAWAVAIGDWASWFAEKDLLLRRFLGLVQLTGWNRPGLSLLPLALERLTDYGGTYALLALGAGAALWTLFTRRREPAAGFVGVWGVASSVIFGFAAVCGSGNDQFFYYPLLSSFVVVAHLISSARLPRRALVPGIGLAGAILLAVLLPWNAYRWTVDFAAGQDHGYRDAAAYIARNLATGEPIGTSGDEVRARYAFPGHPIAAPGTPEEARAQSVHTFVVSPKDVVRQHGRMTPELAKWITAHGRRLWTVSDESNGEISIWHVDFPEAAPFSLDSAGGPGSSLLPARSGFIGSFVGCLVLWSAGVAVTTAFLDRSARRRRIASTC